MPSISTGSRWNPGLLDFRIREQRIACEMRSFDDKHGAGRQSDQAIGRAADDAFVKGSLDGRRPSPRERFQVRLEPFGSISALFGLTNHIIDERQCTILLTAVIGSAVVPTMIAQRW